MRWSGAAGALSAAWLLASCQLLLGIEDTPVAEPDAMGGGGAGVSEPAQVGPAGAGEGGRSEMGPAAGEGGGAGESLGGAGAGGAGDMLDDEAATSERVPVLYHPWSPTVEVCFVELDNAPFAQRFAFKLRARSLVEATWGQVAGFYPWGFGLCAPAKVGDRIVVELSRSEPSRARSYADDTRGLVLNTEHSSDAEILYWFGRGLGFGHEYGRNKSTAPCAPCQHDADCEEAWLPVCMPNGYCGNPAFAVSIMAPVGCGGTIESWRAFSSWDVIAARRGLGYHHTGAVVEARGRCLEINGASKALGSVIDAWVCVGQYNNNTWYPRLGNGAEPAELRAVIEGEDRCVDLSGSPADDNPLRSQMCDASRAAQDFRFELVQIKALGDTCVEASAAEPDATLRINDCAPSSLNLWSLADERLQLAGTELCVTTSAPLGLGVLPRLRACDARLSSQRYRFSGGEVEPADAAENVVCWDVLGGLPTPTASIGLWNGCGQRIENNLFHFRGQLRGPEGCVQALGEPDDRRQPVGVRSCADDLPTQLWDWYF